ncbi:MAG TPA: hypothetical protein PK079_25845 [Leptospiraceae bacterium]|nr:hypothetical protein [Leptospiraceae bacterium]HMW04663.1 hypothetical protein [Leptospiraceae bacterium]HMX31615.1 hypothetical protein [Leptospiraceae bacterium]HMY30500.1 hypothetical protein [Leptospiraceae bacterium]HMZ65565.1 hypothetical protein [Leptospiraceae bacterium]
MSFIRILIQLIFRGFFFDFLVMSYFYIFKKDQFISNKEVEANPFIYMMQ